MIHLPFAYRLPFAYLGPGAGFAFLGSFFTLLISLVASAVSFVLWPLRAIRGALRRGRGMRKARVRRVILIGLEGLDGDRAEALLAAGRLPGLSRLPNVARLQSTRMAPGDWNTFVSGTRSRGHEPFWKVLGQHAVGSTILLVPGSVPEPFDGRILVADASAAPREFTRFTLTAGEDCLEGELPANVRFRVVDPQGEPRLEIGDETWALAPHVFTPWVRVGSGMVRFVATAAGPEFTLYASPIQTDPARPERPISHPRRYSTYLAKLLGPFATTPEAADEAALYAGAIENEDFLMQIKLAQDEREELFFSAIEHQPSGVVAGVFDMPGRIERIFPAYDEVVDWSYREIDRLVGRALEQVTPDTALLVVSNHERGALYSNQKLAVESAAPEDVAPTLLGLFGISQPEWMDGRPVIPLA
jgi:hypothetical protein